MGMELGGRVNLVKIRAPRVNAHEMEVRKMRKGWDQGKGDLGEQFHFTLPFHFSKEIWPVYSA